MNRNQAINWCKDNDCDFITPVFPPPEDWMWCENNSNGVMLQCIFTVDEDNPEIYKEDVL